MHSVSRMRFVALVVFCVIIALAQVPRQAEAYSPTYYIETLGGRAKLFDETISGFLGAYDIFEMAMADPEASGDSAINLYFAAARMANIIFREDETTDSLRNLFNRYGIILTGDSFSSGSPDEIEILEPVDYDDNIILPGDAPDTEALRSFLATSMISEINGALANLDVITNTNFKAIIPAIEIESDLNLEIDYGDVRLFEACLKGLKAFILIATAYDLDLDPHFLVMGINSEYGNFKQILDRFQDLLKLLPTSTTSGDGAGQLALAQTTLEAAISDYLAASDEMKNDPGTEAGAEEFFEIGDCGLREEGFFRELLTELQRSLQATDVANLIMGREERWVIHDGSDVNKEIEVEFWESDGDFESTNWTDRFIAWWGEIDCIVENGSTTTLYLEFWDWVDSQTCYGEATLTTTSVTDTTVEGTWEVIYYGSTPNCTGTDDGTFSGTREVFEETLNINLNPLFDDTPDLRDMLPDFDRYGEALPGTMGNGLPGGPDPTLGGMLISSEEDGEITSFTQDFWTRELDLRPGGVVTIPTRTISVTDNVLSDWNGIDPVFEDIADDEEEDIVGGDIADLYLAKDADYLYIRMTLNDGPPSHDDGVNYSIDFQYYSGETTGDLTTVVRWNSSAADWRVVVQSLGDGQILFDEVGGYAQEVVNDLEWKVPLSDVEPLTGRFIHAATEWWWDDVDYNGTRLLIGPVTTISGEIDGSFSTGEGALRIGVFRPGMPVDAEHLIAGTLYIGNEIDNNPLTYQVQNVPVGVPLLILAIWDHDLNGINGPGDLGGGYSGNPLTLLGPRSDIDITLGESIPAQISGTITYSTHSESGNRNLVIWGSTEPGFPEHQVLFTQAVPPDTNPPISYGLGGLPPQRYFLYYFLDLNQNSKPDIGEPFAYQGYQPAGDIGYPLVAILDLEDQASYADVDVTLQPATLDPSFFNIFHEERPNTPHLDVSYIPFAPYTAISSVTVDGDGLLAPVDITWSRDEWHEYWYLIPESSFVGGSIPTGQHSYTVYVQTNEGYQAQYTDNPVINPLSMSSLLAPADWAAVGTTPTFHWSSVSGAARYRLEISNDKGYRIYSHYTDSSTLSYTLSEGVIFPNETYHWRIISFDSDSSDYSNRSRSVWRYFTVSADSDQDGLLDAVEIASGCLNLNDADTDDDGIPDGVEDANQNGVVDSGETDPCDLDTDGDGIQDGTELGYTLADIGSDTDQGIFQPDLDPATTTDPLNSDTDGDGRSDGEEDENHNGKVDSGELDPNAVNPRSLPFIPLLLDE